MDEVGYPPEKVPEQIKAQKKYDKQRREINEGYSRDSGEIGCGSGGTEVGKYGGAWHAMMGALLECYLCTGCLMNSETEVSMFRMYPVTLEVGVQISLGNQGAVARITDIEAEHVVMETMQGEKQCVRPVSWATPPTLTSLAQGAFLEIVSIDPTRHIADARIHVRTGGFIEDDYVRIQLRRASGKPRPDE